MTDDPKKTSSDDEYQFPQDEYLSSASAEQPAPDAETAHVDAETTRASRAARWTQIIKNIPVLQNKRAVIAVVVVIAIVIMLPLFNSGKKATQPPAQTASTVEAQPVVDDNVASDVMPAHHAHTASKIRDLQAQVADLQSAVDQLKTNNDQLTQTVTSLTGQVHDLMNQLGEALANVGPLNRGPRVVYHLRAVLPDRAWITTNSGDTLTVTVGDEVKHYGVVRSIDPENGVIETSSGRKITYGVNDY